MNDRNDEETVELIQEWWREYGTTVIAAIVIVIAGVVGWHFYDEHQTRRANEGALAYRTYVDALEAFEADRSDDNRETLLAAGDRLKADYAGTAYAVFAALGRARLHVIDDDLDAARLELEWAREEATSDYMRDLALVRLARVQYAAGNNQGALWALDDVSTPGMEVLTSELRGDVLVTSTEPPRPTAGLLPRPSSRKSGCCSSSSSTISAYRCPAAAPASSTCPASTPTRRATLSRRRRTLPPGLRMRSKRAPRCPVPGPNLEDRSSPGCARRGCRRARPFRLQHAQLLRQQGIGRQGSGATGATDR